MARKQFLSFLLIFSLLISCASALAEADDDDDWDDNVDDAWEMEHPLHSGDYAYALLDDGTVEITSYGGADTEIVIPDTLDGKPVTAIGERAFYYSLSLTSVTIPDSVTHISQKAFSCCFQLTSITLPSGLTAIESGTFDLCKSLTTIDIPDSVAAIADDAFIGCKALQSFTLSPNHPYFFLADDALCRTADSTLLLYPNAANPGHTASRTASPPSALMPSMTAICWNPSLFPIPSLSFPRAHFPAVRRLLPSPCPIR